MPDQDDAFAAIDSALTSIDSAITANDRSGALSGLFGALGGINALALPEQPTPIVVPTGAEQRGGTPTSPGVAMITRRMLHRNDDGVDEGKLQERLKKALTSVDAIVERFHPDSWTVSAGCPLGVSVSLTWNAKKNTPDS